MEKPKSRKKVSGKSLKICQYYKVFALWTLGFAAHFDRFALFIPAHVWPATYPQLFF